MVAIDGRAAGVIAAADIVRPNAARAIADLKAMGIEPVMMTGDTKRTAEAVAKQVGIDRVFAEVLPEDKAARREAAPGRRQVHGHGWRRRERRSGAGAGRPGHRHRRRYRRRGRDGDIVLMKSDPADVLAAIRLSKATVRKMKQNLFWAAIYNVIAIPMAAGVLYPWLGIMLRPEFGALAMSASSITVVSNALLLRRMT